METKSLLSVSIWSRRCISEPVGLNAYLVQAGHLDEWSLPRERREDGEQKLYVKMAAANLFQPSIAS